MFGFVRVVVVAGQLSHPPYAIAAQVFSLSAEPPRVDERFLLHMLPASGAAHSPLLGKFWTWMHTQGARTVHAVGPYAEIVRLVPADLPVRDVARATELTTIPLADGELRLLGGGASHIAGPLIAGFRNAGRTTEVDAAVGQLLGQIGGEIVADLMLLSAEAPRA